MLTKIFLELKSPKPLDRESAWTCLTTNLVVLPGLGTLLAGRKSGFFQAGIALIGLILSALGVISFGWRCFRARQFLWSMDPEFMIGSLPDLLIGVMGITIFLVGWIWALISSLHMLRTVPKTPVQPPVVG